MDGIDWSEHNRRWREWDNPIEYQVLGAINAGDARRVRAISHPLDRYLQSETINFGQYDAGITLFKDYTTAVMTGTNSGHDGIPAPKHFFSRAANDIQLDASRRYIKALKACGKYASFILVDIIFSELTAEQHGRRVGISRFQAVGALQLALNILQDHYDGG